MSVFQRKTSKGLTKEYHYRFNLGGKTYSGVCDDCTTEKKAKEFEKKFKEKISYIKQTKNLKALVLEQQEVLSDGIKITLADAYEVSLTKPRKRQPAEKLIRSKRGRWLDFVKYMADHYPDVINLSDVKKNHADEYIQYIRTNGRWNKEIKSTTGNYKSTCKKFSAKASNDMLMHVKEVFTLLKDDASLLLNPFAHISKQASDAVDRDIFSIPELHQLNTESDDFLRPLFLLGAMTALRKGDVCTLLKKEVDLQNGIIRRTMNKTKKVVEIPIMEPLLEILKPLMADNPQAKYLLPEQAHMYMTNESGIDYRVSEFLSSIGIDATQVPKGRSRAVSAKGFHSLRHTFCYLAGIHGMPISIVQSIVGHMSPQMTAHYQKHSTLADKRRTMAQLSKSMGLLPENSDDTLERMEILDKIKLLPLEDLRQINKKYCQK